MAYVRCGGNVSSGQGIFLTRLKRRQPESQHQVSLFQWARLAQSQHPELKLLHAIPNGGKRDARTAARLKAEGVLAGIPDVFLPVPRGPWHGIYLELKAGTNRLTERQAEILDLLNRYGYRTAVCYGWLEAKAVILGYLGGS